MAGRYQHAPHEQELSPHPEHSHLAKKESTRTTIGNVVSMAAGVLSLSLVGTWVLGVACGHLATVYAFAVRIKRRFLTMVTGGFGSTADDINAILGATWLVRLMRMPAERKLIR
jgi:hypothetical protein